MSKVYVVNHTGKSAHDVETYAVFSTEELADVGCLACPYDAWVEEFTIDPDLDPKGSKWVDAALERARTAIYWLQIQRANYLELGPERWDGPKLRKGQVGIIASTDAQITELAAFIEKHESLAK